MLHTPKKQPSAYTDWGDFDADAYAGTYFAHALSIEDQYILDSIMAELRSMQVPLQSWDRVADIGTGPNLYPGMSLAPFVRPKSEGGRLDLLEYSPANIRYLRDVLKRQHPHGRPGDCWERIEKGMAEESHHWEGAFRHVRDKAQVVTGDLFDVEPHAYDALVAVFVAESMTDKLEVCERATRHMIDAVKPGGFLAIGFILGSQGYPAGGGTLFPAVAINLTDVERMFKDQKQIKISKAPGKANMRPGYTGVGLAIGRKL
jgi:hypothetical protein